MQKLISIILFITVFYSCSHPIQREIHEFYFPLNQFEDETIYTYLVDNGKRLDTIIWKFKKTHFDHMDALISESYSQNCIISHNIEVFDGDISRYLSSTLFELDKDGQIIKINTQINPNKNIVFPFKVWTDKSYSLEIKYNNPSNDALMTIERIREYDSKTNINFKGYGVDCVVFTGREVYKSDNTVFTFNTKEYFAKSIGLIRSVKVQEDLKIQTWLIDIK